MAPPPTLTELISTVHQDSPSTDALDLLATASTTMTELSTVGDAVLDHFVAGARRDGRSWAEISSVLGVSKQAAHKRFAESGQIFERFTDRARRVLVEANEAARGLGHNYVGTEHLLLGLYDDPQSLAGVVLARHKVTRDAVAEQIEGLVPRHEALAAEGFQPPYTPRTKEALAGTVAEALQLGHNYIGTEHLLLGLFRDHESVAAKVLAAVGLTYDDAKADVVELLSQYVPKQP